MAIEEAVRMLRGPEGSKVTIWVDRKGWSDARRYNIVRERIKIESVREPSAVQQGGLHQDQELPAEHRQRPRIASRKAGQESQRTLKGLVLDLRNNPGGLLEQAIRVSDKFLSSGDIVTTVGYGNKLREPKRARWAGTESELPIAVLVNKGSASASEIVAGALKNLDRSVIVGETTFGKGSVQVLYDFADNSALKLTIAQYLTPGAISIQNTGVTPDIELKPAWVSKEGVRLFYRPDGHRERNLAQHLDRAGEPPPRKDPPAFSMTYLLERNDDEELPPDGFVEDYPIRLSREFLIAAGGNNRTKMLKEGKTFFRSRKAAQGQKIAAELAKLDVDWRERPENAPLVPPKVEVKLSVRKAPDKDAKTAKPFQATRKATVEAGPRYW